MDTSRLSQLASVFGQRHSRRDAIRYTGLGLGAAALGATFASQTVAAQEATPTGEQDHLGLPQGERTYTMFIQTARAGSWAAKEGEEGVYTLTMTGLPAQTVYFSDRPSRVVGTQTTSDFLNALGFDAENPPNAALVTTADDGADDILVIELFNPVYTEGEDEAGSTLVYEARILNNYHDTRLGGVALNQDDTAIPAEFAGASLFIDDCADGKGYCKKGDTHMGGFTFGCCYSYLMCRQCGDLSHICYTVPGCEDGSCGAEFTKNCFI